MKHFAILALASFVVCQAMTTTTTTTHHPHHTHGPRPTHESNEMMQTSFFYSHVTQNMIVKTNLHHMVKCYIAMLSDAEKANVHTDTGLMAVELKLFSQLASATPVTKDMLQQADVNYCMHGAHNMTVDLFTI